MTATTTNEISDTSQDATQNPEQDTSSNTNVSNAPNSSSTAKPVRMNWLDAARLSAAFSIIAIHSTTDRLGKAFMQYEEHERIFPVLMRTAAELASTEFFILVSLFLLAFKLERRPMPYGSTMLLQAKRLLIPFAVWTIFYAFFVLIKANAFGYLDPMIDKTLTPSTWVNYFLLGTSQYHMHFLPTIFLIFLFHPVFKLAVKLPLLGLLVIPFLAFNLSMSTWIWSNVADKETIHYLARITKVLSYLGYGFAAYSLVGLWQKKFDAEVSKKILYFALLVIAMLFIIKLTHAEASIEAGSYIPRIGTIYYAHTLLPIFLILAFFGSQYFKWPEKVSNWSKFTFGTYLMHPAVIDMIDLGMKGHQMPPYQYVVFKYILTLSIVLGLSMLISRIPLLAWTIGLGPIPFTKAYKKQRANVKQKKADAKEQAQLAAKVETDTDTGNTPVAAS